MEIFLSLNWTIKLKKIRRVSKKIFAALQSKKGGTGAPGPLPWIRHCYYVQNKGRNIVTYSHKDLTKKHEICEFCSFR